MSKEFDPQRGYTFDSQTGENRELTSKEQKKLARIRIELVQEYEGFIKENAQNFDQVVKNDQIALRIPFITVAFTEDEEYVHFIDWIYDELKGRGLEFTNVPVSTSCQIRPWVLQQGIEIHPLRPVTVEDIERAAQHIVSPHQWDVANLDNFHMPSIKDERGDA